MRCILNFQGDVLVALLLLKKLLTSYVVQRHHSNNASFIQTTHNRNGHPFSIDKDFRYISNLRVGINLRKGFGNKDLSNEFIRVRFTHHSNPLAMNQADLLSIIIHNRIDFKTLVLNFKVRMFQW